MKYDVSEYQKLNQRSARWAGAFLVTAAVIGGVICVAIAAVGLRSSFTLLAILAFVLLFVARYFQVKQHAKAEEALRVKIYGVEKMEITNPIFRELYEEFHYDQFEGVLKQGFFENWKVTWVDEHNQLIDLIYTKQEHEIAITISNNEVSIMIDEETDNPTMQDIPLDDEKWKDVYVLFSAITVICKQALQM